MEAGIPRTFDRELNWLAFNRRVLEEARDPGNPPLERTKFLAIVASNLDEFCMVRLPLLHRQSSGHDPGARSPAGQCAAVWGSLRDQLAEQYRSWREEFIPLLAGLGLRIVPPAQWSLQDRDALIRCYQDRLEPVLTPLAVDPTRPFPVLAGKAIHVALRLESLEAGKAELRAIVTVPGGARLLALDGPKGRYALVEDVVQEFLDALFVGYRILGKAQFRVTRDSSLDFDEDSVTDLLSEMEEELLERSHGRPVRLEARAGGDPAALEWVRSALDLKPSEVLHVDGPLDLGFCMRLAALLPDESPERSYPAFEPRLPPRDWTDPFAAMAQAELILHHPFDSFLPVVQLIAHAAEDPAVLAIKQTLYRVSGDSPIVAALMAAARKGKQVTVVVELKARFDEEANIRWAKALEHAGAHVIYGLVGLKVHAKLLLIVRREAEGIRRYCHIGTGNYNDRTAKLYTDLGYFTTNEAVARDLGRLFNMLSGFAVPPQWERLGVAPFSLRRDLVAAFRREAEHAAAGRGGLIRVKCNALVDPGICEELYAASRAGVRVELTIRGICVLRPGVAGLSENIRVRSVVGRFLEHSRIYHFANAGNPVVMIGSADMMDRNLDRRVEAAIRIEDPELQVHLCRILDLYWSDNASARELGADGVYRRREPGNDPSCRVQDRLLQASCRPATPIPPAGERTQLVPLRRPRAAR